MSTRTYRQVARARTTERTRGAILDATVELFRAGEYEPPMERIAAAAGVTTRTVLRHFGSKDELTEAAIADQAAAVEAERAASPGDPEAFVSALVDHYEGRGDDVLRALAAEDRYPVVRRVNEHGRELHAGMVERAFAADLDGLGAAARARRLALLVAVTDVYTWALLRRRGGLDRAETEAAIVGLVDHARGGDPE